MSTLHSPRWHRVAALKPRLAPSLRVRRQHVRGWTWIVLSGGSGRSVRLERAAWALAGRFDGRNVFEVEARLVAPGAGLRPGLLGRAEIGVDRRPLLLAWFGRALDRVRLAWWAWIG